PKLQPRTEPKRSKSAQTAMISIAVIKKWPTVSMMAEAGYCACARSDAPIKRNSSAKPDTLTALHLEVTQHPREPHAPDEHDDDEPERLQRETSRGGPAGELREVDAHRHVEQRSQRLKHERLLPPLGKEAEWQQAAREHDDGRAD